MKRVLIIAGIMMILLTGCSAGTQKKEPEHMVDGPGMVHEEPVGMGNPWSDVSKDEFDAYQKEIGSKLTVPEDAKNVIYRLCTDGLAEIQFELDDLSFVARAKSADAFEDISGLYYDWSTDAEGSISGCESRCYRYESKDETVDLSLWFDPVEKVMYSLSTSAEDLDGFDLEGIVCKIFPVNK